MQRVVLSVLFFSLAGLLARPDTKAGLVENARHRSQPASSAARLAGVATHRRDSSHPPAGSVRTRSEGPTAIAARVRQAYRNRPLTFEADSAPAGVPRRFVARGADGMMLLTATEVAFAGRRSRSQRRETTGLRMRFVGARRNAEGSGVEELPGKSNYFVGNDPGKWRTGVRTYSKVGFRGVYPGVDLVYYGNPASLEYDFILAPGVHPRTILLAFSGTTIARISPEGHLLLRSGEEEIQLRKPLIYQKQDAVRRRIEGGYVLRDKGRVGFHVAAYDESKPLVIDPELVYSTFLGGTNDESEARIAVDSFGNFYVTGRTGSRDFPAVNALLPVVLCGRCAFVTKFNPAGSVVYSTYLAGTRPGPSGISLASEGLGIAADAAGNAYVTGHTQASDFPIANAVQPGFAGAGDAFLAKLSPTGSALLYSTYLGGGGFDSGAGIAVDAAGNVYVTGFTYSSDFPTASPVQALLRGAADAFVSMLSPDGTALVYSTYLGGTAEERASAIAVDPAGGAYVTGSTQSTDFPTINALLSSHGGGTCNWPFITRAACPDAFASKLSAGGRSLVYSTYLGGDSLDEGMGIAVDAAGSAYVTGTTSSGNFPTVNAIRPDLAGSMSNAFVAKLNAAGSGLVYSTYLGGSYREEGSAIAVDEERNVYVTGNSTSIDFPLVNAMELSLRGFVKNTDGTTAWTSSNRGLLGQTVRVVRTDPRTPSLVYAGTELGLFKSRDGGETWNATGLRLHIFSLAVHPTTPTTLYAGAGLGLSKSTDGGETWIRLETGVDGVTGVVIDPQTPSILYATGDGVGKSTDDGRTWRSSSDGLPRSTRLPGDTFTTVSVEALAVNPADPSVLYAGLSVSDNRGCLGGGCGGLYKSTDGGTSWRSVLEGTVNAVVLDPTSPSIVYAAGARLYKSTDGGTNWSTILTRRIVALAIDPANPATIYGAAGSVGGVFKSMDAGGSWSAMGPGRTTLSAVALDPARPQTVYAGASSGGDVFITKLNRDGSALIHSSYFGGYSGDFGTSLTVDRSGHAYVAGVTRSSDFPTTASFQPALQGRFSFTDAFVSRIAPGGGCPLLEPQIAIALAPGFYIAEVRTAPGTAEGYWAMGVSLPGALAGGFNLGGGLRENGAAPGFGAFYLSEPQTVRFQLNAQAAADPARFSVAARLFDAERRQIGPEQSAGTFERALPAGFYILEVGSGTVSPRGIFQLRLGAPYFSAGMNLGGFISPDQTGFGAFYLDTPREVRIQLFGRPTFGAAGIGCPRLTLLDSRRNVVAASP